MSPAAISISTCASSSGARRRSVFGGISFEGTCKGLSSASFAEAAAVATSPWARRTSARLGWGSHAARCASSRACSAPSMSPLRSRIRPSSVSGHPISRRRYGRSSSHATSSSSSASLHNPRSRRISARWTRQRPWRLPIAFVLHQRSIASVHCSARRTARVPEGCTRARSRRRPSTADRGPRRPSPPASSSRSDLTEHGHRG